MSRVPAALDQRARDMLDFERDWRVHQGCKEDAIAERFGISAARYYQLLSRLVERDEALDYDPLTVRRLRRRRRERASRSAARLGERPGP